MSATNDINIRTREGVRYSVTCGKVTTMDAKGSAKDGRVLSRFANDCAYRLQVLADIWNDGRVDGDLMDRIDLAMTRTESGH